VKYMLDTNACIVLIRERSVVLLDRLKEQSIDDVCVSSITAAELEYGVAKSSRPDQNREALDRFLVPLNIAAFDHDDAQVYGRVRAHLEAQGTPIGSLDTLIGAHALRMGLTLVTNNTREFARVPGLAVEDWAK
jgi:tRNA(fMet)-specific endonuclease VapC